MTTSANAAQPTQTTTTTMSPEQRNLYNLALPGVTSFAASVPQRYQGSQIAPFDPSQVAGQNMALDAAGQQGQIASGAAGALPFFFNMANGVDPSLSGAIDAAVRPINKQLTETALPAVRSDFGMGNFGGSRQGIAEGLAIQGAQQATGDTSAKLAEASRETTLNSILKAIGLSPTVQQEQQVPAATTSAVGDVRQAQDQALLNQDVSNFNWDQYAPFLQSKDILSLLTGLPGGTTTSTANNPPQAPGILQGLGGAASGAALGSMLFPGIGTGIGAGAGALLPFLFH